MLQEEQSSSTVVYQAVGDIWQECQEKASEADREAQDQDYKRRVPIAESCCSKDETLCSPKEIFQYLSSILVCRDTKTSLDVLHGAYVITGTRFALAQQKTTNKTFRDFQADGRRNRSEQDQETFGQKIGQECHEAHSVKRRPKIGRCERTARHSLHSGR